MKKGEKTVASVECMLCHHKFKHLTLNSSKEFRESDQLDFHLELDCGLFGDCLHYLFFARTTAEEEAMNADNIRLVYNGQTANEGLVRSLNKAFGLVRSTRKDGQGRPPFAAQFTRRVYGKTVGKKGNLYLMVVRRSESLTEVKNSEYSSKSQSANISNLNYVTN